MAEGMKTVALRNPASKASIAIADGKLRWPPISRTESHTMSALAVQERRWMVAEAASRAGDA
jgi:hypothetical protein